MLYTVLFLIGFLNALHGLGNNLSIYMAECGYSYDLIGLFCLLGIPFSIKIIWSCAIDYLPLPFLQKSPRKGWFLVALVGIACSFGGMALSAGEPWPLAMSLFTLSLFAGCLYMVGICYELESIDTTQYAAGSSLLITGYRIGLLFAGAGVLYIAHIGSWPMAFMACALCSLIAAAFVLLAPEPYKSRETLQVRRERLQKNGLFKEIIVSPFKAFVGSPNWQKIVCVILLFKLSDHMSKPMEGPFYLDLGFSKQDLALAAKIFGFSATVLGAFFAVRFLKKSDPFEALAVLGLVHAVAEGGCFVHSLVGKSFFLLWFTSLLTNLTGGMAITAFISLLWKSCDKYYAPLQYAFFWSLSSLPTKLAGCVGGFLAAHMSWPHFFGTVWAVGVIGSLLLLAAVRRPLARGQALEIRT